MLSYPVALARAAAARAAVSGSTVELGAVVGTTRLPGGGVGVEE